MTEKRFLSCIMTEGLMLLILGLCILVLPRVTELSYGVMLASAFITYGLFKIINSIMNKNYGFGVVYGIIMGVFLTLLGVLYLLVPKINLLWLIEFTGIYFILESAATTVFAYYLKNRYSYWGGKLFSSIILFTVGLLIILGVPVMSFWLVTVLAGVAMVIKGFSKLTLSVVNMYNYNV